MLAIVDIRNRLAGLKDLGAVPKGGMHHVVMSLHHLDRLVEMVEDATRRQRPVAAPGPSEDEALRYERGCLVD